MKEHILLKSSFVSPGYPAISVVLIFISGIASLRSSIRFFIPAEFNPLRIDFNMGSDAC